MNRIAFVAAGLAVMSGSSAIAADVPLKAAPAAVVAQSWNGFYVGGNAGAAWSRANVETTNAPGPGAGIFAVPANLAGSTRLARDP